MEVVASLSQGRTAAAQCGLFTYKSVPVIFEPPCRRIKCSDSCIEGMKVKCHKFLTKFGNVWSAPCNDNFTLGKRPQVHSFMHSRLYSYTVLKFPREVRRMRRIS